LAVTRARVLACLALVVLLPRPAGAADKGDVREHWHTPFDLYLDPLEAYQMKLADPQGVVFIDVRNRAEVQYVGFADAVDANIPLLFFDTAEWAQKEDSANGRYRQVYNDGFVEAVDRLIAGRGLDRDAPVILMCKSGSRVPIAARELHDAGYTRVYTQHEGFEGIKAKSGPSEGKRVVNGWKNRGLPWGYRLPTERMYFNFAASGG
jgi:rhodanese-related sulfurtransferase